MSTNFISPTLQKKEIISATKTLHVFNPEHDLALAVGKGSYTPPAEVMKFRKEKSLLPAIYAEKGDFILVRDEMPIQVLQSLQYYKNAIGKNLSIVFTEKIPSIEKDILKIQPWGWDHSIVQTLKEIGISDTLLPQQKYIDKIRELSHRRNVIPFRRFLAKQLNEELISLPLEVFSLEEVQDFLKRHEVGYFKAPWSSSGRGIVVSDHISEKGLLEWCHGTIRKQGSIIVEPAWKRVFDFATEWEIENKEPYFLGYSVFQTSSRGKYHGNIENSQSVLEEMIIKSAPSFSKNIIMVQYEALKQFISPFYNGYLGIDMLADEGGRINPCVEINLRLTMGHLNLLKKYDK